MRITFGKWSLLIASWSLLLVGSGACVATSQTVRQYNGATPKEWSQRLAAANLARLTNAPKWDYAMGLFTLSLVRLHEHQAYLAGLQFAETKIGTLINDQGTITGYKPEEYQLDALNPGKTALALWHATGQPKYLAASQLLYRQLAAQPRTPEGGFWHKQRYTNQMWLDGVYMAEPFYGECLATPEIQAGQGSWDDLIHQITLVDAHTYDPVSGLNYHGWDSARVQTWANPVTGCSSNFWGRAEGWYVMALVDTLDYLPANHPSRATVLAILDKTARGIVKWQDPASGLWWQVLDQGARPGNYHEATAAAMFVYALAKAVNHGYLSRSYIPAIELGYAGLTRELVANDGPGQWSLIQCCSVAGLGFTTTGGRPRDGSFDYYINEPIVKNDLKGLGPFVLAGLELEKF